MSHARGGAAATTHQKHTHTPKSHNTQIMATVDSLARLALAAFRELRALSVRDLVRSLLVLLSERVDSGQGGYRVRFFGCCVFLSGEGVGGWTAGCAFVSLPGEIGAPHTHTHASTQTTKP